MSGGLRWGLVGASDIAAQFMGGNGIVLDYDVIRYFTDAEALYSYEGTSQMNNLIVGRGVTGYSAFV